MAMRRTGCLLAAALCVASGGVAQREPARSGLVCVAGAPWVWRVTDSGRVELSAIREQGGETRFDDWQAVPGVGGAVKRVVWCAAEEVEPGLLCVVTRLMPGASSCIQVAVVEVADGFIRVAGLAEIGEVRFMREVESGGAPAGQDGVVQMATQDVRGAVLLDWRPAVREGRCLIEVGGLHGEAGASPQGAVRGAVLECIVAFAAVPREADRAPVPLERQSLFGEWRWAGRDLKGLHGSGAVAAGVRVGDGVTDAVCVWRRAGGNGWMPAGGFVVGGAEWYEMESLGEDGRGVVMTCRAGEAGVVMCRSWASVNGERKWEVCDERVWRPSSQHLRPTGYASVGKHEWVLWSGRGGGEQVTRYRR